MASLFKNTNSPFWWAEIWIEGQRKRRSLKIPLTVHRGKAQKAANELEAELRADHVQAQRAAALGIKPAITVEDALTRFYLDPRRSRPRYQQEHVRLVEKILGRAKGISRLASPGSPLHEITSGDLETFVDRRRTDGTAEGTIRHELLAIMAANKGASEVFRVNTGLKKPRLKRKRKLDRHFVGDEVSQLFADLHPDRPLSLRGGGSETPPKGSVLYQMRQDAYDFAVCVLMMGPRRGDLLDFTWPNVADDFTHLRLRRHKVGGLAWLSIPREAQEVLQRRYRHRLSPLYVFPAWVTNGGRRRVDPTKPRTDFASIRKAIKRLGLNDALLQERHGRRGIHALRATAANRVADAAGTRVAQVLLGHTNVQTTEIYLGKDPGSSSELAAQVMEGAFNLPTR